MSHLIPPRRLTLAAAILIASGRALGAQAEPLSLSTARDAARRASPTIAAAREALAAARSGQAEVHCEFCGQSYRLERAAIAAIFAQPRPLGPEPPGLQ